MQSWTLHLPPCYLAMDRKFVASYGAQVVASYGAQVGASYGAQVGASYGALAFSLASYGALAR